MKKKIKIFTFAYDGQGRGGHLGPKESQPRPQYAILSPGNKTPIWLILLVDFLGHPVHNYQKNSRFFYAAIGKT